MVYNIKEVRNAASLSPDNVIMYVEINHPEYGWLPFTLDPDAQAESLDNDAIMAVIGSNFKAYVPPTQEELDAPVAVEVRKQRDDKLVSEVDPLVCNPFRWDDFDEAKQAEWIAYRQALLDVSQQSTFPHDITWPTKPE